MVDGQVGFHRPENVRRTNVEKNNPIVRQIEKTKRVDDTIDLYQAQQDRLAQIQAAKKKWAKEQQKQKALAQLAAQAEKEAKSYDRLFQDRSQMTSVSEQQATADATAAEEYEDDFF